jgi:hypothetical protein
MKWLALLGCIALVAGSISVWGSGLLSARVLATAGCLSLALVDLNVALDIWKRELQERLEREQPK